MYILCLVIPKEIERAKATGSLRAMFHFRLLLAEIMHLKHLILCSLPVRNIFACHRVAIAPKPPTCHGVGGTPKTEAHRINRL